MGSLLSIEVIRAFDVGENDKTTIIKEIGKMPNLRKLRIKNLRKKDGKEFCSSLEKLTNLRELSVDCSDRNDKAVGVLDLNYTISVSSLQYINYLELVGHLEKMPPWIRNLQNLGLINLLGSNLEDDPLELLQHLPHLIEITLWKAYKGESLSFKTGGLLKLKRLYLNNMERLRWVRVEEGAMPNIRELDFGRLPLMEDLPLGIEHLKELQLLETDVVSYEMRKKFMEGKDLRESQDYKRIAHIPSVKIWLDTDGEWQSASMIHPLRFSTNGG